MDKLGNLKLTHNISTNENLELRELLISSLQELFTNKQKETTNTISNILSMREIGNKTHGDLGEVAITELIKEQLANYTSRHVGKELFRAKTNSEDLIISDINGNNIPVSLKAYGIGPLQLSTDKGYRMFPLLEKTGGITGEITGEGLYNVLSSPDFGQIDNDLVLSIIDDEKNWKYKVISFNPQSLKDEAQAFRKILPDSESLQSSKGKRRIHPVWVLVDKNEDYLAEVRYGGTTANALQRGLWTNTAKTTKLFTNLTAGWMPYSINKRR